MNVLLTLALFGAGLLGILIHIVMKFSDVVSKEPKNGQPFMERLNLVWSKFDVLGNLVYAIFAFLVIIVFAFFVKGVEPEQMILIGYAADSAFKNLSNLKQ